jgi:predicted dehydrogenase
MTVASLKLGLIGLGNMGQNHLRVLSLLKGVEIAFIHDADPARQARLAAMYGVPGVDDVDAAMAGLDAAVIATPTSTHAEWVERAARHVRNIFVEKPLAGTLAEAERLAAFARERGLCIQVGFIERFNPAVQVLERVLAKSARVISVDFTRTNKLSARITDVDVITDLMIHDIDLAMFISGPVKAVSAHGAGEGNMIDFASALLTHESGCFSRIQASRVTEKKMRTIQATCRDMFVDCDLLRKEVQISRQSELRLSEGEPYVISALAESVEVRPQEALLSELQAFVAVSRGEHQQIPDHVAGLEAMRICERIQDMVHNA